MISRQEIKKIVSNYDPKKITIGVLGGHSGLDVCHGGKKHGFRTVAVCQKGREKTYSKYYFSRENKGCVDEVILVDKFADIVAPEVQQKLREINTIFVHNRYFWVYCNFNQIENDFLVPIYGTRGMLKLEERDVVNNQYSLLKQAGIRIPKIFTNAGEIDRLAVVKVNETLRSYERAFFLAINYADYQKKSSELLAAGIIDEKGLAKAIIEEFIVGAPINFNYFYSPLNNEIEFIGADMRRQTNLDGLLRLPVHEQTAVLQYLKPRMIETGHVAVTMKESLLEKAFELGEKFVDASKKNADPGIIGPFALQGAVTAEGGSEDIVIFDVSMRIPGAPGMRFTPYSGYLYGESLSYGERIAMEIKDGLKENRLADLVT